MAAILHTEWLEAQIESARRVQARLESEKKKVDALPQLEKELVDVQKAAAANEQTDRCKKEARSILIDEIEHRQDLRRAFSEIALDFRELVTQLAESEAQIARAIALTGQAVHLVTSLRYADSLYTIRRTRAIFRRLRNATDNRSAQVYLLCALGCTWLVVSMPLPPVTSRRTQTCTRMGRCSLTSEYRHGLSLAPPWALCEQR